jgi:hypothetical protein
MTIAKMMTVEIRFITLGRCSHQNASHKVQPLSLHVKRRFNKETIAPSNLELQLMLTVVGENAFQTMDSQMLVVMKRLMPRPYPFWSSSLRRIIMSAAMVSWMIRRQTPVPMSFGWS